MGKLDERIVPKELMVGIKEDLCFVTWMEKKGKKEVVNSPTAWKGWSSNAELPITVKNEFTKGFRLAGVNHRWSSQAKNQDNLLIEHPLFLKKFEIGLQRLVDISEKCTIVNGELDVELIMDKNRNIITREEYEERVKELDAEEAKQAGLKAERVPPKEHKIGQLYVDIKTEKELYFLGSVSLYDNNGEKITDKFVYLRKDYSQGDIGGYPAVEHYTQTWGDQRGQQIKTKPWGVEIYSTKRQLSPASEDTNIFENMSDEKWEVLESVWNKTVIEDRGDRYTWKTHVPRGGCWEVNFLKEYEEQQER